MCGFPLLAAMPTILSRLWYGLTHPASDMPHFLIAATALTVVFVGVMALLHRLPPVGKKWVTIICTFVAGLYFLVEYLWPTQMVDGRPANFLTATQTPVNNFVGVVFVWTLVLGLISLAVVHGRRIVRREHDWPYSTAFFAALLAMMIFGFWSQAGDASMPLPGTEREVPTAAAVAFDTLYRGVFFHLNSTMFALLAFYIASAAYRAFRVRSVEAGLLMFSALFVMLGMTNTGLLFTSWIPTHIPWLAWMRLENISGFLMGWVNSASFRAVEIGVGIGALAMSMRLWLSLERGAFFSEES